MWIKNWVNGNSRLEDLLIKGNVIPTLTVCFRKSICDEFFIHKSRNPQWKMADFPLWIVAAKQGKCHYMNEIVGVYRILEKSASHFHKEEPRILFILSHYEILYYFAKLCNNQKAQIEIENQTIHFMRYKSLLQSNDFYKQILSTYTARSGFSRNSVFNYITGKSMRLSRGIYHTIIFCKSLLKK